MNVPPKDGEGGHGPRFGWIPATDVGVYALQSRTTNPDRSIPANQAAVRAIPLHSGGTLAPVSRPLRISPCQRECSWAARDELIDDLVLFACTSCGSEWVSSEPWTPADGTGAVPEAVQRERERRGRGWQVGQK
jgi:hypothetical protein